MEDDSSFYKKPGCGIWLFVFCMFAAFIAAFWEEIPLALLGWLNIILIFFSYDLNLNQTIAWAMMSVTFNVIAYLCILLLSLFVVAQFALPVCSKKQRFQAFSRLLRYLVGLHGPAISVREGKIISQQEEMDNFYPGVALVDLSSAIVLEKQSMSEWKADNTLESSDMDTDLLTTPRFNFFYPRHRFDKGYSPKARVQGPGVVFTRRGEKIVTAIDLRKQIRTELDVKSFTRDGIELNNIVFAVFSLSDAPEVIHVGYVGGAGRENIFGLTMVENKREKTVYIKEKYELDPEDAAEIHNYVTYGSEPEQSRIGKFGKDISKITPYPFDEKRVFQAAYAQSLVHGLGPEVDVTTPWHEFPQRIVVKLFREELEHYSFDELFKIDQPSVHPLQQFKANFGRKARFQGILSYQLVKLTGDIAEVHGAWKWNNLPFCSDEIGFTSKNDPRKIWQSSRLAISPIREFYASKVLRDRGIKLIASGFPEFRPSRQDVREKLIENWKARWDRDIQIVRAEHTLKAIRTKNLARAAAKNEMTTRVTSLLNLSPRSKEALALRSLQSLAEAVSNPLRQHGLPARDIFAMLQNLQRWLLLGRKELEQKTIEMEEHKQDKQRPAKDEKT